jgi:hypothetical protein
VTVTADDAPYYERAVEKLLTPCSDRRFRQAAVEVGEQLTVCPTGGQSRWRGANWVLLDQSQPHVEPVHHRPYRELRSTSTALPAALIACSKLAMPSSLGFRLSQS